MLAHASEDGHLTTNPAAAIGRVVLPKKTTLYTIDPLTREELAVFLHTVQTQAPDVYAFFLCLARTGMRLGEALALQWGDVDVHGRFLAVRRNLVRGRLTTPKNGKC